MGRRNCFERLCCFNACFYTNCCFRARRLFRSNKTSPSGRPLTPTIALTAARERRNTEEEKSIQDQISLFHFGHQSSSGRRFSHPNQVKYVEEYERRKGLSQPGSPTFFPAVSEFDYDEVHVNKFLKDKTEDRIENESVKKTSASPVMDYPVIPPGLLIL